jgi:hypothetical protein
MTLNQKVSWTSHLVRRTIFTIVLPLAGAGYAVVSTGPPMHVSLPAIFAAAVGFLSCLAVAECNGLIMEAFDCSDLQPGMTGRSRASDKSQKRTNYSSFPRVTAGFALCHTFAFVFAAGATALGGMLQRSLGQRTATGVVAGILFLLTLLLLAVLIRFKEVQIIPESKSFEMERWTQARQDSLRRRTSTQRMGAPPPESGRNRFEDEDVFRPIMIGNPVGKTRRVNVIELGSMTRWTEIRRKNQLIDAGALHLNRAALDMAAEAFDDRASDILRNAQDMVRNVSSRSSRRFRSSDRSSIDSDRRPMDIEMTALSVKTGAGQDQGSAETYVERDCFVGHSVPEVNEEGLSPSNTATMVREHGSHMLVSKVMPMAGGTSSARRE